MTLLDLQDLRSLRLFLICTEQKGWKSALRAAQRPGSSARVLQAPSETLADVCDTWPEDRAEALSHVEEKL